MNHDIVAFIRARLDEEVEHANGATGSGSAAWTFRVAHGHAYVAERDNDHLIAVAEVTEARTGWHIARHDPARVLRGVEAKRRIVERCEQAIGAANGDLDEPGAFLAERIVKLMATEWADHPGYYGPWGAEMP